MAKLDPYNHEKLYNTWKENPNNDNVSKENNKLIQNYIFDMEQGKNISRHTKKGARSYIRLNKVKQKIFFIAELFEKHFKIKDLTKITENEAHKLFDDMRKGKIRKLDGGIYKSVGDYVKSFKAFWHWYQRVESKKGKAVLDITEDLDTKVDETPSFVYFTEEQFNEMVKLADQDMQAVMMFVFDTGVRVTELKNIKVSDFSKDFKEVNIREDTSKTFGRKIKLMICPEVIETYVKNMELKQDNFLFKLQPPEMNKRLKPIGEKILNNTNLTLYDFRHSSACYWYPRYPNIQGLLYRFGWKKIEMAHYYSRFLGMEDTITEENLLLGVTKTELEKEVEKLKNENLKTKKKLKEVTLMGLDLIEEHKKEMERVVGEIEEIKNLIKLSESTSKN